MQEGAGPNSAQVATWPLVVHFKPHVLQAGRYARKSAFDVGEQRHIIVGNRRAREMGPSATSRDRRRPPALRKSAAIPVVGIEIGPGLTTSPAFPRASARRIFSNAAGQFAGLDLGVLDRRAGLNGLMPRKWRRPPRVAILEPEKKNSWPRWSIDFMTMRNQGMAGRFQRGQLFHHARRRLRLRSGCR